MFLNDKKHNGIIKAKHTHIPVDENQNMAATTSE